MRSFHPTMDAGIDTCCESLGFENAAQYEVYRNLYLICLYLSFVSCLLVLSIIIFEICMQAIANFFCDNCKYQRHQCFACGVLGSSDKSSAEVLL